MKMAIKKQQSMQDGQICPIFDKANGFRRNTLTLFLNFVLCLLVRNSLINAPCHIPIFNTVRSIKYKLDPI